MIYFLPEENCGFNNSLIIFIFVKIGNCITFAFVLSWSEKLNNTAKNIGIIKLKQWLSRKNSKIRKSLKYLNSCMF